MVSLDQFRNVFVRFDVSNIKQVAFWKPIRLPNSFLLFIGSGVEMWIQSIWNNLNFFLVNVKVLEDFMLSKM